MIALVLGLPLHYLYGLATLGHLGPVYLDSAILFVGTGLAWKAFAH
jgi:hypothetical protein